ncbi:hypothetical protein KO507_08135 [Gilvimarinus agarilyticus]|uniref:hypothetical protein n=1 Tax=unclassified Gilvimarinus TaxID=2642066 RepID=UPI001C08B834|nr:MULTISPECIES: hypothetical protein [unclassified Gilvimarinus]MBU2885728.1 hypothetical protein [Gilvimarinus agarilyticus]MDO6570588.1 hypothetical protein [Gilvimarinus sp. 2_MG-2023]MDO6748519.1 hypothetical protein [Gilvimarinus sp. 1_MG-2023]
MELSANIEQLLPHAPPMVLLDSIIEHSETHILCQSNSHLAPDNPLRTGDTLSVYAGIEYAAQAMAVHTRLSGQNTADAAPRKGVIAVASKLQAAVKTLDAIHYPLDIRTDIIAQTADSTLCSFTLEAKGTVILQGQLTAMLVA